MSPDALSYTCKTEYVRKLREWLHYAYQKAREEASKSAAQHKRYYDLNARSSVLHPGDRVLVRKVGLRGKQKLADRWESQPYMECRQPNEDIPVYVVRPDNARSKKTRTLHRNLLLPFMSILDWHIDEEDLLNAEEESHGEAVDTVGESDLDSTVSDTEILLDADVSSVESVSPPPSPRYRIPQKRQAGTIGVLARSIDLPTPDTQSPRPQRTRRKPTWMNSNNWGFK